MLWVVVVVRTIEVVWHYRDIIRTILAVEKLAVLQSGDLRQGVGLVGFLQLTREQTTLSHWLWSQTRIDATRAQEQQLLAAVLPCRVDDVHL